MSARILNEKHNKFMMDYEEVFFGVFVNNFYEFTVNRNSSKFMIKIIINFLISLKGLVIKSL